MNIALAINYLYPTAKPIQDFIVQSDGPSPIIREGSKDKGKVRYEIKSPQDGEEEIEGIHFYYSINYDLLVEGEDYDIIDSGPYISFWNIDAPIPSQDTLESAWQAYLENEDIEPPYVPTEIELLQDELTSTQLALTDTYEQLLISQDETTAVQEALVEVYELLLTLIDN